MSAKAGQEVVVYLDKVPVYKVADDITTPVVGYTFSSSVSGELISVAELVVEVKSSADNIIYIYPIHRLFQINPA